MNTAEQKKLFLQAMTLQKEYGSPIFKGTKKRKFFNSTIWKVIAISIGLLLTRELAIIVWQYIN